MKMRPRFFLLALGFLIVKDSSALACATCGFGQDASTMAFVSTTGILTVVPLALIGGLVFWLRRKVAQGAVEHRTPGLQAADRAAAADVRTVQTMP